MTQRRTPTPAKTAPRIEASEHVGYGSTHVSPERMAAMRQDVAVEAMKGPTRGVLSGHNLSGVILAASVMDAGNILITLNISGVLSRPEGQWEAGKGTITVEVPAKKITGD